MHPMISNSKDLVASTSRWEDLNTDRMKIPTRRRVVAQDKSMDVATTKVEAKVVDMVVGEEER